MTTRLKTITLVLAAVFLASSVAAEAQGRRGGVRVVPRGYVYAAPFYGPYRYYGSYGFYDPFWGPYYPYGAYAFGGRSTADVKVQVVPKQTEVFVDGFYAGTRTISTASSSGCTPRRAGMPSRCTSTDIGRSPRTSTCGPTPRSRYRTRWTSLPPAK